MLLLQGVCIQAHGILFGILFDVLLGILFTRMCWILFRILIWFMTAKNF